MKKSGRIPLIIKILLYQIIFLVVHYLYDWFPNSVTYLFGATNESVFQHMKAVFYAYLLLTGFEYALLQGAIRSKINFLYGRMFCASIMPLLMMTYFLTGPAFFVKIEGVALEILFANLALIALSFSIFMLEGYFEKSEPAGGLKVVILVLFALTLIELVIFSYRLPWFDIFASPPGW